MRKALIVETAVRCLELEFPPGLTSPVELAEQVNGQLRDQGVSVDPDRLVDLLESDERVLVEYRDGSTAPWIRLRASVTDDDARARLIELLIEGKTLDEIAEGITGEAAAKSHPLFSDALRFLAEGTPNALDESLREVFARELRRFPDDPRAVELVGVLQARAG